jgi:ATP-dependent Lon protease
MTALSMDYPSSQASITLPDTIGMIVLEDCYLLPGCFLPLYIFEQRYRDMLEHALNTSRMFCVGTISDGKLLNVSTAGLVRACKKQEDGTSHVMLYGMSRIKFTGWEQHEPYRIATVEEIPTLTDSSITELEALKARALELLPAATAETGDSMNSLRRALAEMKCADRACDILSYHFVRESEDLEQILSEPKLEKRYSILLDELERLQTLA